jgi:hypothetical protein
LKIPEFRSYEIGLNLSHKIKFTVEIFTTVIRDQN